MTGRSYGSDRRGDYGADHRYRDQRDYRDTRHYDNYQRWNRDGWRRDRRYDWNSYRYNHRDVFRLGRYYSPYRDYSYRRFNIGYRIDSGFYGSRYYINDPWRYRLPQVYGPYRWVRYYDDVLLVDIYRGEVVDVCLLYTSPSPRD